ncbi:MAG: 5-formyltetrahydrofolate cyclo-ligase [Filimonas sp.]|nr:5-formyltetrahydrofolate cyclo-ligase [Filimonas sp.]
MTKQELRNLYKQKRNAIDSKERLKLDDLLLIQFQQLSFDNVHSLFTYWPLAHQAEPNTLLFSSYLRHMIPGLQIAYPVVDPTTETMQAVLINEETVYHTNHYGITEPTGGAIVPPAQIDLVFAPMLICDQQGYRVGYGKGYYDKFLESSHEHVLTIGFSYFEPVENIADTQSFDVPLSYCVTPTTIYEF